MTNGQGLSENNAEKILYTKQQVMTLGLVKIQLFYPARFQEYLIFFILLDLLQIYL